MPRGYRSIILAVLGCLSLAVHQPPKHQSATKADEAKSAKPVQPPFTAYPDPYSERCYSAQDHDAAELCAEWRSAVSGEKASHEARRATNWAIVATLLSFIGVGGLIWTIIQTSGSLKEARRGNRLAMKANARATRQAVAGAIETEKALSYARETAAASARQATIAGDTAKRQLRAYIGIVRMEAKRISTITEEHDCIQLTIKNFGQTPATVSYVGMHVHWYSEANQELKPLVEHKNDTSVTVAAGQDIAIPYDAGEFISRTSDDDSGFFSVFGHILYKDVFNKTRRTTFSFMTGVDFFNLWPRSYLLQARATGQEAT